MASSMMKSTRLMRSSTICNAARPVWRPGPPAPAHLDGSMAGDFGFDPLNLGAASPEQLRWYQQAELVHGRTAMTAVAGILIPSVMTKLGFL